VAGTCGYGEGISGSINAGNFLTSCKVYWLASQEGLLHGVTKWDVPILCGFSPVICLTTEEKARKNLSQDSHT
jgi:hypothetical protein